MPNRRTAAQHAHADGELMLNDLLRVKDHREARLRRQMMQFKRQQAQIENDIMVCRSHRDEVTQQLQGWLGWSGVLVSHKLLDHKQAMQGLHHQQQELVQHQQTLRQTRSQLQAEQDRLRQSLLLVMRKKEKLRSLLNDEH